jgi:hypothetical protein
MHHPMTVAFEINRPWREKPWREGEPGYRPAMITIWHVDPEADGTDDSCGWFAPKATDAERKLAMELANEEANPVLRYFFNPHRPVTKDLKYDLHYALPGDTVALCYAAIRTIAWRLDRREMDLKLTTLALDLGSMSHDNFQHVFGSYKPAQRVDAFLLLIRAYRRVTRPWYHHPRWHIRHWQIQVQSLQALKRWLFSRCSVCGKRFSYGESPMSGSWNGTGPRWFRGEPHVAHMECYNRTAVKGAPTFATKKEIDAYGEHG